MDTVISKIGILKLIPVITVPEPRHAIPLGEAIMAGGLPLAEITFRSNAALDSIRIISQKFPEMIVGAGTVLTIDQVQQAITAGATFIVSPGFNPRVVNYCIENNIPIIPGVSNPSLIEMALESGLKVVKFFPAEACGGLNFLKAIAAPYPQIKFVPTGGINAKNLEQYLEAPYVHACGGSWIVNTKLIETENFTKITALIKEAREMIP